MDPLVPFPWDNVVAIALALVAYYWGVASGYQTAEMKKIADSGTGVIVQDEPDRGGQGEPASKSAGTP